MSVKTKLATAGAAIALSIGSMLAVPQAAYASHSVDMHLVCQATNGADSFRAILKNKNSAFGWKCWNAAYPEQVLLGPFFNADIAYWCWITYGGTYATAAYYTNASDPYSWRCAL